MTKVFHFDFSREQYLCDAAVVWCFDHRFHQGFAKFLKRSGLVNIDAIKIAGGAKCLASPAAETDREFVLEQIRTSIRLHATKVAILMVHTDCGAYGGLPAFGGNSQVEAQHLEAELRRGAANLQQAIPDLEIRACFVNFEGVWSVELAERSMSAA